MSDIDFLLSPLAVRARARKIFDWTTEGRGYFSYNPARLDWTVNYVLDVIKKNYPDLNIPFHSRWGHFRVGGIDRVVALKEKIANLDPLEQARIQLDLVVPSVLLDAGAGEAWKFNEASSGKEFTRSEGLGVASLELFLSGTLSSDGTSLRADAAGLSKVQPETIAKAFQVSDSNPLIGVEGRAQLLRNLGHAVTNSAIFPGGRPGGILDSLMAVHGKKIPAPALLRAVLNGLGSIWPGRVRLDGINLGDVWRHNGLAKFETASIESLVPFHKLSQWMTYSLIEPIESAGCEVTDVEKLTGLAEYRNGGLMIDAGLITLKDPKLADKAWTPDSDLIIEWRALTIYLLDEIGTRVQTALERPASEFPLAKVLEGGTWWAGRFLAKEKREGGNPPLQIQSDGTVF